MNMVEVLRARERLHDSVCSCVSGQFQPVVDFAAWSFKR